MVGLKIGVDLGTSMFRAYAQGTGEIFSEPSVISIEKESGTIASIGEEAYEMLYKSPDVYNIVKPLEGGSIVNYDVAQLMLNTFFERLCKNKVFKPTVAACMPAGITALEERALLKLYLNAGAGRVCLLPQPLAAAIGAGVILDKPFGTMVVDIGAGTADIAVVTMGSTAVSRSVKVGGDLLDKSIIDYLRINRSVIIGEKTAEQLKFQLAGAVKRSEEIAAVSKGKSKEDGMPVYFEVTAGEINIAIKERLESICKAILSVLETTPPELLKDIAENGIILSGNASRLFGLDLLITEYTSIKSIVIEDPSNAVVKGLRKALRNTVYLKEQGYSFKTMEDI
ncbi:MAG TPA: rod shape-determining protein [Clostridia bacterium]|nr:rod shape-determining protein [Clostridia bacterium]